MSRDTDRFEQLATIPLFEFLDSEELAEILDLLVEEVIEEGEIVCHVGDPGDTLYVVESGRLEAWGGHDGTRLLNEMTASDCFGEYALLFSEPRSATVRAAEHSVLLSLQRDTFERFFRNRPKAKRYFEKVRRKRRINAIGRTPLFSFLEDSELHEIERLFKEETYEAGNVICAIGEPGDAFYVVLRGEVEVLGGADGNQVVGVLGPPNFFGELALVLDSPRTATVRASHSTELLVLRRHDFQRFFLDNEHAMEYLEEVRENRRIQILEQIPLFSYLEPGEIAAAQGLLEEQRFVKGDTVFSRGEEGDCFYVVQSGSLEVWGGPRGDRLLSTLGPSDAFGEQAILLDEPRAANVIVIEDSRLLVLRRQAFDRFFSSNETAREYVNEIRMRRRVQTLERIPLFQFVAEEELDELLRLFEELTVKKGESVFDQGDESEAFFVVMRGELEVRIGESAERRGRLLPGDFFGELALILREPRHASVVATQRSMVLKLDRESFHRFFFRNPRAVEYFSRVLCQRLASTMSGEKVGKGTIQIGVTARPGRKGKTLVARALAEALHETTGQRALLVQLHGCAPTDRAVDVDVHLSLIERSIGVVLRSFRETTEGSSELLVGFDPEIPQSHGARLSELANHLREVFGFHVFDLGCRSRSPATAANEFLDVLVEIVDEAEPVFGLSNTEPNRSESGLTHYPVINLFNSTSRRIPINSCVPFVLPKDPLLARQGLIDARRSPGAIPIRRLANKILGRSVGLALGGGAAFGLAHLGVLKVLEENNIPIDLIVGCSMGSLVAVSYAAGFTPEEMIAKAAEMGRTGYLMSGLDFTILKPGLLSGERLKKRFTPLLGARNTFEDLFIPCRAVATDIESGELVTIGRGSLEDAYRASSSVPLVLSPEALDGRVLVDGGVADPVPAETARHMGADLCFAVNVVPPLNRGLETLMSKLSSQMNRFNPLSYVGAQSDMPNFFDITMNALQTLQHELGSYKALFADACITPDLREFTWTDFDRSDELIDKGAEATENALPELLKHLRKMDES